MLNKFKALFLQDNTADIQEDDVKLSAATLMFELIRSDGNIDSVELTQLTQLLKDHFSLTDAEVQTLIDDAQSSAEDAISLQKFTRQICENWSNEQRVQLIEYMWLLAFADQHLDTNERHLVRKVAGLLYLTDRQINIAQERAKQRLAS